MGKGQAMGVLVSVMASSTPAVVLAAGFSRRLGRDKALVEVNGRPLVRWLYDRLEQAGCQPVVIVVNEQSAPAIARAVPSALLSVNSDPDAGRTGSFQCGLRTLAEALGTAPERVVMAPVDRPGWNVEVLDVVLQSHGDAAPAHNGRNGHPVLLTNTSIETVMASDADRPLRELVVFTSVSVHAPWLGLNIDTHVDVEQLLLDKTVLDACFSQGEGI
jgi:molybdenum cofactor cytidylyltransferase